MTPLHIYRSDDIHGYLYPGVKLTSLPFEDNKLYFIAIHEATLVCY
jgi:hypothetical protein